MYKYALFLLSALAIGLTLSVGKAGVTKHGSEDNAYTVADVVSVDGRYVKGKVHLLMGKKINGEDSLWYQSSSDEGKSWSEAINITEGEKIEARFHRGNDARLAVQGDNIAVVWMSKKEGAPHNSGPMMARVSHDGGLSWKSIQSPADWHKGSHGFFAMDATESEMSLAWLDSRQDAGKGAAQGLQYANSTDGGETWSQNQTLDLRSCACCWNSAHYSAEGQFYIMYRDKDPSDMALGKIDAKNQWQRLSTVGQFNWDFQGCPHIGGNFDFDEINQTIHATVGTGHEKHTGAFYLKSTDKGITWQSPVRLGDETAVHSDVAALSNGQVLTSWDHITEKGFQVVYASSPDQGESWSDATTVSTIGLSATHPRILAMKDSFLLLWTEGKKKQMSLLKAKVISQ